MHLIGRYIFRRSFSLSMLALVSTTVMVLVTQVLIYVNVLTASGQAIGTFFTLAATIVPAMANVVMPFALLIGASQTLNTMNSDSELAVIEAAGGAPTLTAQPIVVLALLMAVCSLMLSTMVEPWANTHKRQIISDARADLISVAVQSGTFQKIQNGIYLQVAEQLPSGEFGGVFIADSRDKEAELIYYARRGSIRQIGGVDILALEDGEVHRKTVSTGELSVVRFVSYVVDLNQFSAAGTNGAAFNYPSERSTYYLLFGDRSDEYFRKVRPDDIRTELNRRFSDWLYPLAFGMIAVFFGARASSNRQERIWSLTAGASVAVALRGAGFYFANNSGGSSFYTMLTFAFPLGSILFFAWMTITQKSLGIADAIGSVLSAALSRLPALPIPFLTSGTGPSGAGARR